MSTIGSALASYGVALPVIAETPVAGAVERTVRGRDLHAFLEVRKDFSDWIKVQIERARLHEGRDYVIEVSPQKGENPPVQNSTVSGQGFSRGGRPRAEYHLTVEAAKHIGMMSGTDRGFDLREYFIECERRAKAATLPAPPMPAIPTTFAEALQLAADKQREVEAQAARIADLEPKAAALRTIAETDGTFCIRDAAKALQMRERDLRGYLAQNGWIYRRDPRGPWCARSEREAQGWMRTKIIPMEGSDGRAVNRPQARIASAGLVILARRLGKPIPPEAQPHLLSFPPVAR